VKRLVIGIALVAALLVGLDAMADATQNRPDDVDPDSTTTLTFSVDTKGFTQGDNVAGQALWAVCATTVDSRVDGPTPVDGGWEVTLTPALGHHSEKRLVGCLEDATVDRVSGHLDEIRHSGR
jgi:hypothetical protein